MKNKGVLPEKDMREMTGPEYVEWVNNYLLYEDDDNIPMPSPKDQAFLDALGSQRYRTPQPHEQPQQGDGWKLGCILTLIAVVVLVGLALK